MGSDRDCSLRRHPVYLREPHNCCLLHNLLFNTSDLQKWATVEASSEDLVAEAEATVVEEGAGPGEAGKTRRRNGSLAPS